MAVSIKREKGEEIAVAGEKGEEGVAVPIEREKREEGKITL